ncbi:MAG: TIGR03905 family TSCPD domain-containing protein [Sphaerochaetaceae bacterium]|nr:TIGR03905 family TSCPD domain-containing protein [Sphaerochaetaceae bacterium]
MDIAEFSDKMLLMKEINYRTSGVCARAIHIVLTDDDVIEDVVFDGGCDGNHRGLACLCRGMKADEVQKRLSGVRCGMRMTSCPDQLAKALSQR